MARFAGAAASAWSWRRSSRICHALIPANRRNGGDGRCSILRRCHGSVPAAGSCMKQATPSGTIAAIAGPSNASQAFQCGNVVRLHDERARRHEAHQRRGRRRRPGPPGRSSSVRPRSRQAPRHAGRRRRPSRRAAAQTTLRAGPGLKWQAGSPWAAPRRGPPARVRSRAPRRTRGPPRRAHRRSCPPVEPPESTDAIITSPAAAPSRSASSARFTSLPHVGRRAAFGRANSAAKRCGSDAPFAKRPSSALTRASPVLVARRLLVPPRLAASECALDSRAEDMLHRRQGFPRLQHQRAGEEVRRHSGRAPRRAG